jgi:hypothetical protein
MSEPSKRETPPGEPAATREPYASPKLVRYGTIGDLTRGATGPLGGDATSGE